MISLLGALSIPLLSPFLPEPMTYLRPSGETVLSTKELISCNEELKPLAELLAKDEKTLFQFEWKIGSKGRVKLVLDRKNLRENECKVESRKEVSISGGSYRALCQGVTTFLQFQKAYTHQLYDAYNFPVRLNKSVTPQFVVTDSDKLTYSGLMIDVARKWHSVQVLEQCIELARLYKLRYLQLHLSDDQAFTFPSASLKKATTSNQHGGPSYTVAEMKHLVAFADQRGVTLIPEIDLPGHSASLIRTMPDLFKITGTKDYDLTSTINFAKTDVVEAVDKLVGEVCAIFKSSPYFHMGGDEADLSHAEDNSDFQAAFKSLNLPDKSQHELFRRFINQVNAMTKKRGKKLIVWEGFGRDPNTKFPIDKDITVMEFESAYYLPKDILDDGYKVINAAWTPLYVVNKHVWPPEKALDWNVNRFGRFGNTYPAITWFDVPPTPAILGAQVCSWEQPEYLEIQNLRRVVPAMAQSLRQKMTSEQFANRLENTDRLLSALVEPVTFSVTGTRKNGPDEFDVVRFTDSVVVNMRGQKNQSIHYTLDGSPVTMKSPLYYGSIALRDSYTVRAANFGPGKSYETAMTFYKEAPNTPNLATGQKVKVSGGTQVPQNPELAVDNNLDLTSSWWANPAPQWLEVDLGEPKDVSRIEVFPYWDGSRYYQYTIEVRSDENSWKQIVDMSQNKTPASSSGTEHKFPTERCRYVRINMLKGSANEAVHLVELKVWP